MTEYERTLRDSGYEYDFDELDLNFQPRQLTKEQALEEALKMAGLSLDRLVTLEPVITDDSARLQAAVIGRELTARWLTGDSQTEIVGMLESTYQDMQLEAA